MVSAPFMSLAYKNLLIAMSSARRLGFACDYSSVATSQNGFFGSGNSSQENGDADLNYLRQSRRYGGQKAR